MSHFSVMVIGEDVTQQLAPYQENNCGDCPEQYLEFEDSEEEMLEEYKTKTREMVVMPNGELVSPWDKRFKVPGKVGLSFGNDPSHKVPEGLERREAPFTELYKTFEAFAEDWHGYKGRDPEKGRYGRWENPQRKWDWYSLGGRWHGYFKIKDKPQYPDRIVVGKAGFPEDISQPKVKLKERHADQLCKVDIDIEGMQRRAREEAEAEFDKVYAVVKDCPPAITWEQAMAEYADLDEARKYYNAQSFMKAIETLGHFWDCPVETYQCTKEEFLRRAISKVLVPFAVVWEGKWYEKGEMGWWGAVHNEKDHDEWNKEFFEMFGSLPGETLVSIVDCHI